MTDERLQELLLDLQSEERPLLSEVPIVLALEYIIKTVGRDAELALEAFCAIHEPYEDQEIE